VRSHAEEEQSEQRASQPSTQSHPRGRSLRQRLRRNALAPRTQPLSPPAGALRGRAADLSSLPAGSIHSPDPQPALADPCRSISHSFRAALAALQVCLDRRPAPHLSLRTNQKREGVVASYYASSQSKVVRTAKRGRRSRQTWSGHSLVRSALRDSPAICVPDALGLSDLPRSTARSLTLSLRAGSRAGGMCVGSLAPGNRSLSFRSQRQAVDRERLDTDDADGRLPLIYARPSSIASLSRSTARSVTLSLGAGHQAGGCVGLQSVDPAAAQLS